MARRRVPDSNKNNDPEGVGEWVDGEDRRIRFQRFKRDLLIGNREGVPEEEDFTKEPLNYETRLD